MAEMKSNDVYLDSDGTLGISADVDISKVKRILLTQEGTHYGSMYYLDDSDHSADTNKALGNNSETPNSCSFKPGDKFILEIGQRQLDEFEIAGTDYYIKIYLLKMLTPYKPEVRTQMSSADCVSRQAVLSLPKDITRSMSGEIIEEFVNLEDVKALPSAQPELLTDKEQRIFLAAMGREENVCKQIDDYYDECGDCRGSYEVNLVRICHEIIRKVKGALWTI